MTQSNEPEPLESIDEGAQQALVALARLLGRLMAREHLNEQTGGSLQQSPNRQPSARSNRRRKGS